MKNWYDILGVSQEATTTDIKKAFRGLALRMHPDKGGDAERMVLINQAYETLSDPKERSNFDDKWRVFQEADVDAMHLTRDAGYLPASEAVPYSHAYRQEHERLVAHYEHSPLDAASTAGYYPPFQSAKYHFTDASGATQDFHDIFTFLHFRHKKSSHPYRSNPDLPTEPLTPMIAIELLMQFLAGYYCGAEITALCCYFSGAIAELEKRHPAVTELELYRGIMEIVCIAENMPAPHNHLISSLHKITDFAKQAPDALVHCMLPLFYNALFRNLYAYALHLYWHSGDTALETAPLESFNGLRQAKELLMVLKDRLTSHERSEHLSQLIRYVKFLYNFENDAHELMPRAQTAAHYREAAFHFLDWIPSFLAQSSAHILVNMFMQIGVTLQQASQVESHPSLKMADEQLALKMYLIAAELGNNTTPDAEMYAKNHLLHYLSTFQFANPSLKDTIPALHKRVAMLTDVFLFFEPQQSNVAFLKQENKTIVLMRRLLNAMIAVHEANKTRAKTVVIDHAVTTLLYQAYEACLKNWYQEEYDPLTEQQLRRDLMDELLFENGWLFLDVEQHTDSPWIMVDRDPDGWMNPTRSLPFTDQEGTTFRSINGAEINRLNGAIHFFMTPWTADSPPYTKAFTLLDLEEMLEKKVDGAFFSLDPVDPLKPYHPFNAMRFAPSQLCDSELLNTMLLTDYVLKFLTTNQEVQGHYPFEQRPVATMISHLPKYLRQIITNFHDAQRHSGSLHRFWIEAEEADLHTSDEQLKEKDLTRLSLGSLKMVVKKHCMVRDINGDLQDVGNENEGWPIHVVTQAQMDELVAGSRIIQGHAMIFIYGKAQLFYWENNQIKREHVPVDVRDALTRLYVRSKGTAGTLFPQSTKNMPLLYKLTCDMAHQTGLPHRYSPEFIFAHEFTEHYNEFAQYLPEFGRLRELSKIAVLVNMLNSIRQSNNQHIEALDYLLNDTTSPPPTTPVYELYKKHHEETCERAVAILRAAKPHFNHTNILAPVPQALTRQFPMSPDYTIRAALNERGNTLAMGIAVTESRRHLQSIRNEKVPLAEGFAKIKLGQYDKPVELNEHCFWVPASVRHEVRQEATAGRSRHSFFVYGGVKITPRVNVIGGGNAPLGGSRIGSGAFNRTDITRGFQSHHIVHQASANHLLLKAAGFNIHSRVNLMFLPTQESQHPTRSIHRGGHTKDARVAIQEEMTKTYNLGQAQGWSKTQYREKLRAFIAEQRQVLRSGHVALNSKCRPWANS